MSFYLSSLIICSWCWNLSIMMGICYFSAFMFSYYPLIRFSSCFSTNVYPTMLLTFSSYVLRKLFAYFSSRNSSLNFSASAFCFSYDFFVCSDVLVVMSTIISSCFTFYSRTYLLCSIFRAYYSFLRIVSFYFFDFSSSTLTLLSYSWDCYSCVVNSCCWMESCSEADLCWSRSFLRSS